jgi:FlaA1/EpsC-like NDP-sugar epimerase
LRVRSTNAIDRLVTRLSQLTVRNLLIAIHDGLATAAALLCSYYIRLESAPSVALEHRLDGREPLLFLIVPCFVSLSVVVCYVFRLTTSKWRFVSIPDVLNILKVATALSLALVAFDYVMVAPNVSGTFFFGKKTILMFWCFELLLLGASRFGYRYFRYTRILRRAKADSSLILLIGQTYDIDIFLRSIENGSVKRLWPVGFLSFSRADRGHVVRNIPVLGTIDDLEDIVHDFAERGEPITRVLMAPSAFAAEVHPESIIMRVRRLGLAVNRLPSIDDDDTPQLAPIEVEKLLLHGEENVDPAPIEALMRNKAVVVTGGGGLIGAEICRRGVTFGAARLLIIENCEAALVEVCGKLAAGSTLVEGRLANVRDKERISRLLVDFKPDIVFHAAALRREVAFESDWSEIVKTNILGLANVADAAHISGAATMGVILVAAGMQPASVGQITAEFAQSFCFACDRDIEGKFPSDMSMRMVAVRVGDILAPNSALMTKLRAQIESGGPVTVASPDVTGHFRTAAEACDLMLTAVTHGLAASRSSSGIYILDPGQSVKILDLATRMIRLSGREPGHDIDIVYTGLLDGAPLNDRAAEQSPMVAPGISFIETQGAPIQMLRKQLMLLEQAVEADDPVAVKAILDDASLRSSMMMAI